MYEASSRWPPRRLRRRARAQARPRAWACRKTLRLQRRRPAPRSPRRAHARVGGVRRAAPRPPPCATDAAQPDAQPAARAHVESARSVWRSRRSKTSLGQRAVERGPVVARAGRRSTVTRAVGRGAPAGQRPGLRELAAARARALARQPAVQVHLDPLVTARGSRRAAGPAAPRYSRLTSLAGGLAHARDARARRGSCRAAAAKRTNAAVLAAAGDAHVLASGVRPAKPPTCTVDESPTWASTPSRYPRLTNGYAPEAPGRRGEAASRGAQASDGLVQPVARSVASRMKPRTFDAARSAGARRARAPPAAARPGRAARRRSGQCAPRRRGRRRERPGTRSSRRRRRRYPHERVGARRASAGASGSGAGRRRDRSRAPPSVAGAGRGRPEARPRGRPAFTGRVSLTIRARGGVLGQEHHLQLGHRLCPRTSRQPVADGEAGGASAGDVDATSAER